MNGSSLVDPCIDIHVMGREAGNLTDAGDIQYVFAVTVTGPEGCEIHARTRAHASLLTPLTSTIPVFTQVDA